MRYSIIHHDVREYFKLTVGDYLVADSIHQLSHSGPTKKPNTHIAKFLGVDEGTVRNGKKNLLSKGLVFEEDGGYKTTPLWSDTVTYARNNSDKVRDFSESHLIYKEVKKSTAKAVVSPFQILPDNKPNVLKEKKDNGVYPLREKLYTLFEQEFGTRPTPSMADYKRVEAALKRLKASDIIDLVEEKLEAGKARTVREALTDRSIDVYLQDNA